MIDKPVQLIPQLTRMLKELDVRAALSKLHRQYMDGGGPTPPAVELARVTKAYSALMGISQAPWASLVVDSVQDRLEVGGIRTGNPEDDKRIWAEAWQANALDAESKLAHRSALVDGRAYATIWPNAAGDVEIVYDGADQMVVEYAEGRHQPRHRVAALRRWTDDDGAEHLTLYHADALYKLSRSSKQVDGVGRIKANDVYWEIREERGRGGDPEPWPLPNQYEIVPVVELATNRQLKPGPFPACRGEFAHCLGVIDRINLLTFLGLVVAIWMGFPLRGVIGEKITRRILTDDEGNELLDTDGNVRAVAEPPFESRPDSVAQFENPEAKTFEFKAAERGNLSIFPELAQLAYITKTPAHYFPLDGGLSNISADTVRALEGGLHAKVGGIHKPLLGEGHEEILRVAGLMMKDKIEVPRTAEVFWLDHESRSMAERADAATKIATLGLPPLFIAEKYLKLTQEELRRVASTQADGAIAKLLDAAASTPTSNPAAA